jgi:hypothetical protein
MENVDFEFDETWYLERYPAARLAISKGDSENALDHYLCVGQHLGYKTRHIGKRFEKDPARYYNGFWTDQDNALDVLNQRVESKKIPLKYADSIRHFIVEGYAVIKNAIPEDVINRADEAIEDIYGGKKRDVKFEWKGGKSWAEDIKEFPAKAHDIHMKSQRICNAVLHENITGFLKVVFEADVLASQTLGFYLGSGQRVHQDTAYVTYSRPRKFVGVWTALEDVKLGAGELLYVPKSHKLDPVLFGDKYYSVHEAMSKGVVENHETANNDFLRKLQQSYTDAGLKEERFLAKKGDVLVWSALLAHGGAKTDNSRSRKSVVTHFCPYDSAPNYFENSKRPFVEHSEGVYYSTFAY